MSIAIKFCEPIGASRSSGTVKRYQHRRRKKNVTQHGFSACRLKIYGQNRTPFMEGLTRIEDTRPDHLVEARHLSTSQVFLRFADGFQGSWTPRQLEFDSTYLAMDSMEVAKQGTAIRVKIKDGEVVYLDATWLRAAVDPTFNERFERSLIALRGPIDDMKVTVPGKTQRGQ